MEANGFGWNGERTAQEVSELQRRFPMLPDRPEIFAHWLELVRNLPVHGKRVHDARLAAVLGVYAIDHLITFNTTDFTVFPSLSLINPRGLVAATGD